MGLVWNGSVGAAGLAEGHVALRHALADAARQGDWPRVITLLRDQPDLVNSTRPDGVLLYAPLHQAAHAGAPRAVVKELLQLGAWRTLENAWGERPVDVAVRRGHVHLRDILRPVLRQDVPPGVLLCIQKHFHAVIRARVAVLGPEKGTLRLPELAPLLEHEAQDSWFAVPGMYGGFTYRLRDAGVEAVLVAESWSRVVGGSGQRHEITPAGSTLVAQGFV